MSAVWRLRAAVLLLVGELAVHRGRFLFATTEHEHQLATAHRYLTALVPLAGVLLFVCVAHFLSRLGKASAGAERGAPRARALWLAGSAVLLGTFLAQESLETLSAHGHLPALGDLLGAGGWTAIPFALLAGACVALLLRGAVAVVAWALRGSRRRARRAAPSLPFPGSLRLVACGSVLARRLAGRAPPSVA